MSESIILLDGELIIHKSILKTIFVLGDARGRIFLKKIGLTKREQSAIISESHKAFPKEDGDTFWKRYAKSI